MTIGTPIPKLRKERLALVRKLRDHNRRVRNSHAPDDCYIMFSSPKRSNR